VRTVLIISYWYAPSPAVGAKRFSFLAREFTRMGYDVHVVTNDQRDDWKIDGSLPIAGHVHRCAAPLRLPLMGKGRLRRLVNALLRRLLAPVGWEILWAGAATRKALKVARNLPPGVVIATTPAHAAIIAGARVARRLDWPLIVDYRDPWSAHQWPRWRRSAFAQWAARRLERRLLDRSAARVLNTPAMHAAFTRAFPMLNPGTNFVIPNGFEARAAAPLPPTSGPIVCAHAGEIFKGRSLVPVLKAAASLRARFPSRPVRVITYGDLPPVELARIQAEHLEDLLEVRPRVPFAALFAELQRAHLLLAVVGEHMAYSTPYKVYDYMAAGRPILGIAPAGAALFGLLAESGAGLCVDRDDVAGIEHAIEHFMGGDVTPMRARVERYRWPNLAQQYRAVIEKVAGAAQPATTTATPVAAPGTSSHTTPAGR